MIAVPAVRPRAGVHYWWDSYREMVRYDLASQRQWLPFLFVIQLLLSAGMAVLYGFYLPVIPPQLAAFIVTGTPALALIPIGFISVPQMIADRKLAGTYEFTLAFPVPRMADVLSSVTVYTAIALPGLAVALALSAWRYDVTLHPSPMFVPAVLLTAVTASAAGAAIGHAIGNPVITNVISNLLVFFVLLYAPIVFPAHQFPSWLAEVNRYLPFMNMATVLRSALLPGLAGDVTHAYLVLSVWAVVSLTICYQVISRRG